MFFINMAIINPIPHYRKDIDGLRAIAVLAVVFFHAFPSVVRGGFIGVDIFFVISGFLISTILLEGLARDTFSLTHFYRRRIVRIFPALLLVLVSCLILGWFILLTDEYAQLGKHIAGGAGFLSNYLFWNEAGYFDQDAETKPLLHLWSLGIEEQFYILWPALLWLTYKSRLSFALLILLTGITSFFWGLQTLGVDPSGAFYLPQNRFWELLVGTGLAYVLLLTRTPHVSQASWLDTKLQNYLNRCLRYLNSPGWKNGYSVLGMSLLAFGIYRISKDSHFPGTWVLLPVFGATLLILAGPNAWLNCKVLGHRYLVWCGLISFPLYLWHWPLLAFARITQGEEPSGWIRISIVLLSIILAWLTYWLIEKPIRFGSYAHSKLVLPTLIVLMTAIGLAGYWDYREGGEVWNKRPDLIVNVGSTKVSDLVKKLSSQYYSCRNHLLIQAASDFGSAGEGIKRCYQSQANIPVQIAILGDSFAEHLFIGMAQHTQDKNIMYFALGGIPFLGSNVAEKDGTSSRFDSVIEIIGSESSIKIILLSANWVNKFESQYRGNVMLFEQQLIKTVQFLNQKGKTVYLIESVPNFSFDVNKCKYSRPIFSNRCEENARRYLFQARNYLDAIDDVQKKTPLKIINLSDLFYSDEKFRMAINGNLLFQDRFHLNETGSMLAGLRISEIILNNKK